MDRWRTPLDDRRYAVLFSILLVAVTAVHHVWGNTLKVLKIVWATLTAVIINFSCKPISIFGVSSSGDLASISGNLPTLCPIVPLVGNLIYNQSICNYSCINEPIEKTLTLNLVKSQGKHWC